MRGYFGIGIENLQKENNLGTLWRSAHVFGASFLFTIGKHYDLQCTDTTKAWTQTPLFQYETWEMFWQVFPRDCALVGVEITENAAPIQSFYHPERAIYLLGAENHGISSAALERCHQVIVLPGRYCLNVAIAGSIVLYDRIVKQNAGKG